MLQLMHSFVKRKVCRMAAKNTEAVAILNGPSKFDIMLALFDRRKVSLRVCFPRGNPFDAPLIVSSVEAEDGSGDSWNIKGTLQVEDGLYPFSFYFSTKNRKGSGKIP